VPDSKPHKESEELLLTKCRNLQSSAVSDHVNTFNVLDRLLNSKVEMAVGEVISVSKDVSAMLLEAIRI
jgi:hypothetical protein